MARPRREFIAGGIYHVFSRGSNRQAIFAFDSDRVDFLRCLDRVVRRSEICCLAYCLMPNHYHLVVETRDGQLSRAMQALNGRYANRFNHRYERDAHLFKNRFGAVWQKTDSQLRWTLRYTVMNPVESGLCGAPEQWHWSSYRASAGLEPAPTFLDLRRLWSYFGDIPAKAVSVYRTSIEGIVGV
jgi:REP element-mobilizing transposase RayT